MSKPISKILLFFFILLLVSIIAYLAYVFISTSSRIEDNIIVKTEGTASQLTVNTETKYRITSANLGFGAYSDKFSFFMDGGKYSWAFSRDDVYRNISGSAESIIKYKPDFLLFQEVDTDGTRSWHIDETGILIKAMNEAMNSKVNSAFAFNYNSPFLLWPLYQPHGKNNSGILTASRFKIADATRRSLPLDKGLSKVTDLDRCYLKSRFSTDNEKKLIIYNVHLSAYFKNPETALLQIKMLNEDMATELSRGNYVIAGGDFNREMTENASTYFGFESNGENWTKTFPFESLDPGLRVVSPLNTSHPLPTVRDTKEPWDGKNFVSVIDGFIVSKNVSVTAAGVIDGNFKFSDHNPICMDFILQ